MKVKLKTLAQLKNHYLHMSNIKSTNCLMCGCAEPDEDEHLLACLLMVFVAVSIPKLARNDNSFYRASLEGHANNIHCMASAVNNIFGALFTICGQGDIEDRMKEFLAVSTAHYLSVFP